MLWASRRADRTDRTRAAALLWGGWLLTAGLVLSFMSGISHTYYVVVLAPAIGALAGIGSAKLWEIRRTWFARVTLAVALLVTGGWAWVLLGRNAGWFPWLRVVIAFAALGAACLVLAGVALRAGRGRRGLSAVPVSLALVAGLGGPLAYSLQTAATAHSRREPVGWARRDCPLPAAALAAARSPARAAWAGRREFRDRFPGVEGRAAEGSQERRADGLGGAGGFGGAGGNASVNAALAKLLETGAPGYKWAAATVGSDSAAAMELGTGGVPVMAVGGFSGSDPTPTLAAFEQMVAAHEVHYFAAGSAGGGAGRGGAGSDSGQITSWVESHFNAKTVGGETVYDLSAPAAGS